MRYDALDKQVILDKLGPSIFSYNILLYEKIDSTNLLAKELASRGAPEGTLVLAEEQAAGRGRMERRWSSPGYTNLLFSFLLRPALDVDGIFVLTMILAIAVIDGVKRMAGIEAMIKWPNDLYVRNRKFGGILTEFSIKERKIEYVILGLGLNVNWNPEEAEGILYPTTSIFSESGSRVSRNDLLVHILKAFEKYYGDLVQGGMENLYRRWNDLSLVIGREVEIRSPGDKVRGTALRIDHGGALILRDNRGKERKILSGDVSLRM